MAKKILVVDDEPELVELIKLRIEGAGYEVITALDGGEALRKAQTENPDLIVLDVLLPVMDGFEVCRKLKTDEKYKNIPIIMLTVKFQPGDVRYGKAMGADAYVTKPFEPKVLLENIAGVLKIERGNR